MSKAKENLRKLRAEQFSAYRVVIRPERNATKWRVAQAQRGLSDSGEVIKSLFNLFNNFGNLLNQIRCWCYLHLFCFLSFHKNDYKDNNSSDYHEKNQRYTSKKFSNW